MPSSAKHVLVRAGVIAVVACGDTAQPRGAVPQVGHVVVVVEENTNYESVVGAGAMPYLDLLIGRYGLATQYYANTHPSIGNYFMLTVGKIVTNSNSYADTVRDDNIVRRLVAAGKTWKSYAEGLPAVGYTGDGPAPYTRRHNPLSYLSDVMGDTVQKKRLVPFSQFAGDWAGGALPDYSFIVPNLCNDAHDCSPEAADAWLRSNIKPLIDNARFQQDGLLIIVFDESGDDNAHGGGRIVWVVVSAKARPGYQSTALYQHESTLRLTALALGLTAPGGAATAPGMDEFFVP
jgi:phosphatidylinositol-3-phosphatase